MQTEIINEFINVLKLDGLSSLANLRKLIKKHKNANFDFSMLLHLACKYKNKSATKFLIKKCNSNIEAKDQDGNTPLHYACYSGSLQIIKFLKKQGVNFNAKTNDGLLPLHIVCRSGHFTIVKYLIKILGVNDINVQDYKGNTPLHWACFRQSLTTIKYLIKKGADPAIKNIKHLKLDFCNNDINLERALLEGSTPLELAEEIFYNDPEIFYSNYPKIIKYLRGVI